MKDNAISLDEFWSLVIRLQKDAKRCLIGLDATAPNDEEGKSFWRRMYARSVFALIDGATYRMMFHAYAASGRPGVSFSAKELEKLECAYDFDEAREPVATFCKTQTLDNIQFAFDAFARVHAAAYVFPVHDPEWELIKEIVRIRQDLQFSREAEGIEVPEDHLKVLLHGLQFLVECMVELLESCADSMEAAASEGELVDVEIIM